MNAQQVLKGILTPLERERLTKTYRYLKQYKATRLHVEDLLNTNERTAREAINAVGYKFPVAIEKDGAGKTRYFIASLKDHEPQNLHKIMDRLSRVEEMLYSILPNFKFEKAAGVDWSELEEATEAFLRILAQPKIAQLLIEED